MIGVPAGKTTFVRPESVYVWTESFFRKLLEIGTTWVWNPFDTRSENCSGQGTGGLLFISMRNGPRWLNASIRVTLIGRIGVNAATEAVPGATPVETS